MGVRLCAFNKTYTQAALVSIARVSEISVYV